MSDDRPATQVNMVMLAGVMKAYKGEPPWGTPYFHMSKEKAYECLKRYTKQDFGDNYNEWEAWLQAHNYVPVLSDSELQKERERMMNRPGITVKDMLSIFEKLINPDANEEEQINDAIGAVRKKFMLEADDAQSTDRAR